MRIDAHQHFWRMADRTSDWPTPDLTPICRDFGPADLHPALQRNGIDGTVLVQSEPSRRDTQFLLDLAGATSFVRGVVGWVDFEGADAADAILELAASSALLCGLRPMLQDIADTNWILDPRFGPAIEAMMEADLSFDALVQPRHLPVLAILAQRWPRLRIVIDHAAKPRIATGGSPGWAGDMARLAALPNLHCKLSGLLTEAGDPPDRAGVRDAGRTVLDLFGADRTIFGSDWPVVNLAGGYDAWCDLADRLVTERLGPDAKARVFGGNAIAFYRLSI